jgi:hypothetical protein
MAAKPWLDSKLRDKAISELTLLEKGGLKGGPMWWNILKKVDPTNPMFNRPALTYPGYKPIPGLGPTTMKNLSKLRGFLPAILGGVAAQQIANITE